MKHQELLKSIWTDENGETRSVKDASRRADEIIEEAHINEDKELERLAIREYNDHVPYFYGGRAPRRNTTDALAEYIDESTQED